MMTGLGKPMSAHASQRSKVPLVTPEHPQPLRAGRRQPSRDGAAHGSATPRRGDTLSDTLASATLVFSTTVEFAHRLRVDAVASDSAWPRLDGCAATATSQRDDRALCRPHVA